MCFSASAKRCETTASNVDPKRSLLPGRPPGCQLLQTVTHTHWTQVEKQSTKKNAADPNPSLHTFGGEWIFLWEGFFGNVGRNPVFEEIKGRIRKWIQPWHLYRFSERPRYALWRPLAERWPKKMGWHVEDKTVVIIVPTQTSCTIREIPQNYQL